MVIAEIKVRGSDFLPFWSMYPVAAVPKTPASTPAVLDRPKSTPWNRGCSFITIHDALFCRSG